MSFGYGVQFEQGIGNALSQLINWICTLEHFPETSTADILGFLVRKVMQHRFLKGTKSENQFLKVCVKNVVNPRIQIIVNNWVCTLYLLKGLFYRLIAGNRKAVGKWITFQEQDSSVPLDVQMALAGGRHNWKVRQKVIRLLNAELKLFLDPLWSYTWFSLTWRIKLLMSYWALSWTKGRNTWETEMMGGFWTLHL